MAALPDTYVRVKLSATPRPGMLKSLNCCQNSPVAQLTGSFELHTVEGSLPLGPPPCSAALGPPEQGSACATSADSRSAECFALRESASAAVVAGGGAGQGTSGCSCSLGDIRARTAHNRWDSDWLLSMSGARGPLLDAAPPALAGSCGAAAARDPVFE